VSQARTDTHLGGHLGNRRHEEVHVAESGRPGPDHLCDPELRAPVDVVALQFGLDGPDILAEPGVEGLVVGRPAKERHRHVRVCVDEPRNDEPAVRVEFVVAVAVAGVVDRLDDSSLLIEQHVRALDGRVRAENAAAGHEQFAHTRR
jgi:hypothetical protein